MPSPRLRGWRQATTAATAESRARRGHVERELPGHRRRGHVEQEQPNHSNNTNHANLLRSTDMPLTGSEKTLGNTDGTRLTAELVSSVSDFPTVYPKVLSLPVRRSLDAHGADSRDSCYSSDSAVPALRGPGARVIRQLLP